MSIPDPNLLREIEHQIEENGAFIEKQLNSKILQIRVEYFLDLLCIMEPEERRKTVQKEMAKHLKKHLKDEKLIDDHFIGKSLIKPGVNITETLANVSGILSPTNPLLNPLKALLAF